MMRAPEHRSEAWQIMRNWFLLHVQDITDKQCTFGVYVDEGAYMLDSQFFLFGSW